MARPTKDGLDYFPLDCQMDDKFDFIEAKHGIVGFGVLIKLLQKIYFEGYHSLWNEKTSILFARKSGVDLDTLQQVIKDSLEDEIFDKKLYEKYGVLTSRGIQKRYIEAAKRRKSIKCIQQIALIDFNEYENSINVDINPQSKVKESKPKKSKVNKSKFDFEPVWIDYPNKIQRKEAERHFIATVKTEQDYSDIQTALTNYLFHLKRNSWKKPQNGSTWFNNWQDWIEWEEPKQAPRIMNENNAALLEGLE